MGVLLSSISNSNAPASSSTATRTTSFRLPRETLVSGNRRGEDGTIPAQVQARTPLGNKADNNDEEEKGDHFQHQQAPPFSTARDARSFAIYCDALGDGFERKATMQSTPHNRFAAPTSSTYDDDEDDNGDSMMDDEPL